MKTTKTVLIVAALGMLLIGSTNAQAATIRVPQDYATIQNAVNAANHGDTIYVSPGTYNEINIQITKNLTISSLTGPSNTVVECSHNGRGFIITGATLTNVNIIGLTIQNAAIPYRQGGGAIRVVSGKCRISRCIIQGTTGPADYSGGPISNEGVNTDDVLVEHSIVRNNFAANGAGVGGAAVFNCWVYNNTGGNNGLALASCNATNVTIYGNGGGFLSNPWTVGGVGGGTIKNGIVWNNLPSHNNQQIYDTTNVSYSIVMGGYIGTGNLSADPLFRNAAAGDFSLQAGSPAIGTGDPSILKPSGSRSDIGASGNINDGFPITPYCSPHRAIATATVVNGFVVGATISDSGCGYTNAPTVLIQGGGGSGATATAVVSDGKVVAINITSAGSGYTSAPQIKIASPPFEPTVSIAVSRVNVTQHVVLGRNYVLESSQDLVTWPPTGPPFTAEDEIIVTEFVVEETGRYFRIRQVP